MRYAFPTFQKIDAYYAGRRMFSTLAFRTIRELKADMLASPGNPWYQPDDDQPRKGKWIFRRVIA